MRRRITAVLAAVALAACGGGAEQGRPDPAGLGSCDAVAEAVVAVIQENIVLVDDAADALTEPDPAVVADLEQAGAALEARAAELGCTDDEMTAAIAARAGGLEARSVYGQLIIEGLLGDG
ncbi:MAG: hypothetical protein KQH83_00430 [Actinobacteria bacterium]|nr:hypothetical protein [Actinomycetota bacterium]